MGMTIEQKMAIELRNCNLLVSAAAGSGKTSVLVERILNRVMDKLNPIDIDSIVVVTFTKAAAEEMKSRLKATFEKKLMDNPGDVHLTKQIALSEHAKITTIDSFCSFILKNYYNSIAVDPGIRVADTGELDLIKDDVISQFFEEKFTEGDEGFLKLVEGYSAGKNFKKLKEIIIDLQSFSESYPWPEEWLANCINLYSIESGEAFNQATLVKETVEYIRQFFYECSFIYGSLLEQVADNLEAIKVYEILSTEKTYFETCMNCKDYLEMAEVIQYKFETLRFPTKFNDEDLKNLIKNERDEIKKKIKKVTESYFSFTLEEVLKQLSYNKDTIQCLIDLTLEFADRYKNAKEEKNIAGFSDIEHYALDILIKKDENGIAYTEVADELATRYEEIYIDEYQDSNEVQETILTAVSKCRYGKPNIFMVGDIKQSIYKFRMAKPELFIDKYESYSEDGGLYRKIELHNNFRSTVNVIDSVNDIFFKIMRKGIGGIDYTAKCQLNFGGTIEDKINTTTDIVIGYNTDEEIGRVDRREANAYLAAMKIKNMINENPELSFRDFVILLRSDKKAGPVYTKILNNHGIPTQYNSSVGYFTSYEIKTIMDMLRVIDNPRQEIPLVAVMRSFFAYFTSEELAFIKGRHRKIEFYDCILLYIEKNNDSLAEKCRRFMELLNDYRKKSRILTNRELITELVYNSGFYDYVGLMANGNNRKANLDIFLLRAKDYEKTSYSGLFNFIRYIDDLKKFDVDYGEAKSSETNEDLVRIMSIHHSKGLQFPIVILGDSSKDYNLRDLSDEIILDSDFGIGIDNVDIKRHVRFPSIIKEMIKRKLMVESIGEELRVLYVALTRAIQKLVILAVPQDKSKTVWDELSGGKAVGMEYILSKTNYADLIMGAVVTSKNRANYCIEEITLREMLDFAQTAIIKETEGIATTISNMNKKTIADDIKNKIADILNYRYPYQNIYGLKTKYSVSDLKHMAMLENEDPESHVAPPELHQKIPAFIEQQEDTNNGISRGNAVHKFFELLDYNRCINVVTIREFLEEKVNEKRISKEYAKLINVGTFVKFLETDLGKRMKLAYERNVLFREQPFIMEIEGRLVDENVTSDEKVVMQGIVDAFFFEDNKVYIVDYKTDNVTEEKNLVERYKTQLDLYARTLSTITGKEIGGCYLYSTHFNKEISI